MSRRVVITGVGCVTPLGVRLDDVWKRLSEGQTGIGPITLFDASRFPVRIAAEVRDWDLSHAGQDPADWRHYPRQVHFAVGSAIEAMRSAGLEQGGVDPRRLGVYLGCGETFPDLLDLGRLMAESLDGEHFDEEAFLRRWLAAHDTEPDAFCDPDVAARCLAGLFDAQGPHVNCIAACASSAEAVGNAAHIIRRGEADVMLAGGSHSMIHPIGISGFHRLSVLSTSNDRAAKAMRPFDVDRDGFVVGEGGAIVVLESLDHARARRADIWAELTGFASAHDAYHLTDTHPDGRAFAGCVRKALRQARLNLDQLDYINAHGTSTRMNDRIETKALKMALGKAAYRIPVSSTKSMMGHCTTACGAVELVFSLMTIRTGVIPPTINYEKADPECDLDYVPNTARRRKCRHVLSNSLGFGGQDAALIVSRFDERSATFPAPCVA